MKKTKKERHAKWFPELVKEAELRQAKLAEQTVEWPDDQRESDNYKETIVGVAKERLGKDLKPAQRTSLLNRVIKRFASIMWITGCAAPRVRGYEAHIELKEDALTRGCRAGHRLRLALVSDLHGR